MFFAGRRRWSKDVVRWELMARQQRGEDLSYGKTPDNLRQIARKYYGSYRKAVEAIGVDYDSLGRYFRWTDSQVIEELKKLHGRGVRISGIQLMKEAPKLHRAIYDVFGSIEAARRAAGIELLVTFQRWTKEKIIEALRQRARNKEELAQAYVSNSLRSAAAFYFGSYAGAIEAAGLNYEEIRVRPPKWERAQIILKLQELAAAGVQLNCARILEHAEGYYSSVLREFGSTEAALKAAGVEYYGKVKWNRQKVLDELRQLQREGKDLAYSRVQPGNPGLARAAGDLFGGYRRAVEALGIKYVRPRTAQWSQERILSELRSLVDSGVEANGAGIRRANSRLFAACRAYFVRLSEALDLAGIPYQKPRKPLAGWERSQVLQRLRELHQEGEDLRYAAMKEKHSALFFAARYYFDAYITAVKQAGLDYDRIVKEQLHGRKRWKKVVSVQVMPAVVGVAEIADAAAASGIAGPTVSAREKEQD